MQGVSVEEPDDLLAPERLHNDAHFLRAVTDMADKKEVVTGGAIYSETGIKLLEKDVRLDSRLYEQLIQHKLPPPLTSNCSYAMVWMCVRSRKRCCACAPNQRWVVHCKLILVLTATCCWKLCARCHGPTRPASR